MEVKALVLPALVLSDLCAELCPCLKPRRVLLHAFYIVFLSCWETDFQSSFPSNVHFCMKIKSVFEDSLEDQFRVQF